MRWSNWKQLLRQSCSITSNGIEWTWHTVCVDTSQKEGGMFPLFWGWMRYELNSLATSHFVTIERVTLEYLGRKIHFLILPFILPCILYLLISYIFLLINIMLRGPCKRICCLRKCQYCLEYKEPPLNVALSVAWLFGTFLLFSFFVFLTSCLLRTGTFLVSAASLEAVFASVSHHLSVYLHLLCVKMFWQILPTSVNKVPMTQWNAETRKETIRFMNIYFLWGPFLPGLFPYFILSSLLLSCFLLWVWHEISLLKDFYET